MFPSYSRPRLERSASWNSTAITVAIAVASAFLAFAAAEWRFASSYGELTNDVASFKSFEARQVASNENTAKTLQDILLEIQRHDTLISERTTQAVAQVRIEGRANAAQASRWASENRNNIQANRVATEANRVEIAAKSQPVEIRKPRSLMQAIGITK